MTMDELKGTLDEPAREVLEILEAGMPPQPPTISECFDGFTYRALGQIVLNIRLFAPQLLEGDADDIGRWICCAAWCHQPTNPNRV